MYLVGPVHRVQHDQVADHAQKREGLLRRERDLRNRELAVLAQRLAQQYVGLVGRLFAQTDVVGLIELDRVDRVGVDQAFHGDAVQAWDRQLLQVVLGENHLLVVADLDRLEDLRVVHLDVLELTDPLVLDRRAVLLMHLVRLQAGVDLGGLVELHRHREHVDRDRSCP